MKTEIKKLVLLNLLLKLIGHIGSNKYAAAFPRTPLCHRRFLQHALNVEASDFQTCYFI